MLSEQLDWQKTDGMMPAIIQHAESGEVLMLGYMNEDALAKTQESGKVTFYSRTKQRLWTKGETSGNFLNVVSITPDCDNDTLLVLVNPVGPTCHKGELIHCETVCQRHQTYCAESGGRRRGDRAGRDG